MSEVILVKHVDVQCCVCVCLCVEAASKRGGWMW